MPEYFLILLGILIATLALHKYFKIKLYKSVGHFLAFNTINLVFSCYLGSTCYLSRTLEL